MQSHHVESAMHVFEFLQPGNRLEKRLVKRKCLQVAKIMGIDVDGRYGTEIVVKEIFRNKLDLFTKQLQVTQNVDKICVFSDVYDVDVAKLDEFVRVCAVAGLPVSAFEVNYPMVDFSERVRPPRGAEIMAMGYNGLYRGTVVGVVF